MIDTLSLYVKKTERFGETKYSIVDVVKVVREETHKNNNKE